MSDIQKSPSSKALKIHHDYRAKKRQYRILKSLGMLEIAKSLGHYKKHHALAGAGNCPCCMNPRKSFKGKKKDQLTVQERRMYQTDKEQFDF